MRYLLNPPADIVNSPYTLDNMRQAVETVATALVRQQKIYVQVDSDCDGYTSAAVLINYLYCIAPKTIKNNLTWGLHDEKTHGIDIDTASSMDIDLVIVPDASSNENGIHKSLNKHGIKVVVLDHH